jgi:hypothetical protein
MGKPHVIVWDLDGTLGEFCALEKHCASNSSVTVRTRPGLADALRALCQAGFVHSLLTMATPVYAEVALRGTGLREYFGRVEGQGQRKKGDVAGVARAFGIPEAEVPAQMLFVGDRMMFDEPDDPEVVFHLEPFALTRPAQELERLVLHLRAMGGGSIRQGFRLTGLGGRSWYRLWRRTPLPLGEPVRRHVAGLGTLVLLDRQGECPVIGYAAVPAPGVPMEERCFVPVQVMQEGRAEQGAAEGGGR